MKKIIFFIACLLSISAMSYSQTADEIVNKYIEAVGGKDKLSALKSLRLTGKMPAGPGMEIPFVITIKDQEAMRFEMVFQGKTMVQVVQGDSGWAINPFASRGGIADAERMSKEDVDQQNDQMDINGELFDFKKKGSTIELLGKEDVEGAEAYKLKVTKKDGAVCFDFVDTESNLLIKQQTVHKMQDKDITVETYFSNYKMVDGVLFPHTMSVKTAGIENAPTQTMTYDKVEFNIVVDNAIFKMPAKS